MLPGPDKLLKCPRCGARVWVPTLLSGNTFGAIRWSDGKMEAPMLPERTEITRCDRCDTFYWLEDAVVLGEYNSFTGEGSVPESWKQAPYVQDPDIPALVEAIEWKVGDTVDREKYLRIRLWWALNDLIRRREQVDHFLRHKELFSANLQALDVLLQSSQEPEEQIMRAEIARETDKFDQCLELLADIPRKFSGIRDQFKVFVQKKSQIVQVLH